MASHAFCCDNIRPKAFEDGDYRLGIFIYWARSGKSPQTKDDDNLGPNVPFCIKVTQRRNPRSSRLFVPTGWGEFVEIDRELLGAPWRSHYPSYYQCRAHCAAFRVKFYERSVESSTQSPTACVSTNTRFPDQYGRGDASSSTAMKEPSNVVGEPNANLSAEIDHAQSPVGTDAKYGVGNIASLANMPAGQFVLDLIEQARNTMPLNKVSFATEADILKRHLLHDLRKLTESVDQNISIWMLLTTSYPIAKLLMSCSPSNVYTKNDRAKILEATAIAVIAVHYITFNHYKPQDCNPPDRIEVFEEIRRQHPNNENLTSLLNCALKEVRGYIETEGKTKLAETKVYISVNDDSYDHCDLSNSDRDLERCCS